MFQPSVITGPKNGHIAVVSDGDTTYEVHPHANPSNREFYARHAAEGLAEHHANFLNRGGQPTTSFVRV